MESLNKHVKEINFLSFIDIRFGDPITEISLSNKHLLIGTMLGRIIDYNFTNKEYYLVEETSTENITGINQEQNLIYISIGDEKINEYKLDENNLILPCENITKNYNDEDEHIKFCDSCYTVLYKSTLFRLMLGLPDDKNIVITKLNASYEIKHLKDNEIQSGEINMTNYIVPFDFNLEKFLWIEFLSENERNICVYTFPNGLLMEKIWKNPLTKEFGHISQAKLILNSNMIFIIRNLNDCEIRECDNDFTLLYSFTNIGDMVIAVDITFKNNEDEKERVGNNSIHSSIVTYGNNQNKIRTKNLGQLNDNLEISKRNIMNNLRIYLLDVECNLNLYENENIRTIINLNKLSSIIKDHKDKKLFGLGYQYILKIIEEKKFAFSCDHGCYCFKFEYY